MLQMRRDFQRLMKERYTEMVEELTGRKVLAFLSQAHVEPDLTIEVFLMDGPMAGFGALEVVGPTSAANKWWRELRAPGHRATACTHRAISDKLTASKLSVVVGCGGWFRPRRHSRSWRSEGGQRGRCTQGNVYPGIGAAHV